MSRIAKEESGGIPVTVGFNRKENAVKFSGCTDIVQAHYYKDHSFRSFVEFLELGAQGKKILVGECGTTGSRNMEAMMKEAGEKNIEVLFWDNPENPKENFFDYDLFLKHTGENSVNPR